MAADAQTKQQADTMLKKLLAGSGALSDNVGPYPGGDFDPATSKVAFTSDFETFVIGHLGDADHQSPIREFETFAGSRAFIANSTGGNNWKRDYDRLKVLAGV